MYSKSTLLAGLDHFQDPTTKGLTPSIQPSATFSIDSSHASLGYARTLNENVNLLEKIMCQLDDGVESKVFNSGASAAYAVLSTLKPLQTLVMQEDSYYEFKNIFIQYCKKINANFITLDFSKSESFEQLKKIQNVKLIWTETLTNPFWNTIDLTKLVDVAHTIGAKVLVDATISTPLNTTPLALGCDYVLHSATKYLNGHGDVIAGVLTTKELDSDWQEISDFRTHAGCILQSFEGWLVLRGLRTLDLRMQRALDNADKIVKWLSKQPFISHIYYLGLNQNTYIEKQFERPSCAMITFLHTGNKCTSRAICREAKIFRNATSLGSTESLIEFRKETEGEHSLCPDNLIRLSIGLECVDDLITDLTQMFKSAPELN